MGGDVERCWLKVEGRSSPVKERRAVREVRSGACSWPVNNPRPGRTFTHAANVFLTSAADLRDTFFPYTRSHASGGVVPSRSAPSSTTFGQGPGGRTTAQPAGSVADIRCAVVTGRVRGRALSVPGGRRIFVA